MVAVWTGLSLSFPVLIAAVPLWRRDFTLLEKAEQNKLRRCLFSDGGLSSNFPIHFFDKLLPNSPTFAISLDEFDPKRNRHDVWLPSGAGSGIELPVVPFAGMAGFLSRLIELGQRLAGQPTKHPAGISRTHCACGSQIR